MPSIYIYALENSLQKYSHDEGCNLKSAWNKLSKIVLSKIFHSS